MDSTTDIRLLGEYRGQGTTTVVKSEEELEISSAEKILIKALGSYSFFDKNWNMSTARSLLKYKETVYLNPKTLAGALALMKQAKIQGFNVYSIFLEPGMSGSVNQVINNIVASNSSSIEQSVRIGIQADLFRYITFLTEKATEIKF